MNDFGVVTDDSPLAIRTNGAAVGVEGYMVANEVGALSIGDHVLLEKYGTRWFVTGTYTP